jgi:hypothetical protein
MCEMSAKARVAALKAKAAARGADPLLNAAVQSGQDAAAAEYAARLANDAAREAAEDSARQDASRALAELLGAITAWVTALLRGDPRGSGGPPTAAAEALCAAYPLAPAPAACETGPEPCGHSHGHGHGHGHGNEPVALPWRTRLALAATRASLECAYGVALEEHAGGRLARASEMCQNALLAASALPRGGVCEPVVLRTWLLRARCFAGMAGDGGDREGPLLLALLHVEKAACLLPASPGALLDEALSAEGGGEGGVEADWAALPPMPPAPSPHERGAPPAALPVVAGLMRAVVRALEGKGGPPPTATPCPSEMGARASVLLQQGMAGSAVDRARRALAGLGGDAAPLSSAELHLVHAAGAYRLGGPTWVSEVSRASTAALALVGSGEEEGEGARLAGIAHAFLGAALAEAGDGGAGACLDKAGGEWAGVGALQSLESLGRAAVAAGRRRILRAGV